MSRGQFISIEGGEGVGKSTNIRFIETLLKQQHIDYLVTREPGGTPITEEVRQALLSHRDESLDAVSEVLFMFACRAQHVNTKIKPALDAGQWVICDRFTDASFAYQGGGRELNWKKLQQLETWVLDDLKPDLTFFLDLDPNIGMTRARERGALDRFEQESMPFFQRVYHAYKRRIEEDTERFQVIDASQDLTNVQEHIETKLLAFIKQVQQENSIK